MKETYEQLREYIFSLEIIDTHEHICPFEDRRNMQRDVFGEYLAHYFSSDLVSAGMSLDQLAFVRDPSKPIADRWTLVEPFWEAARHTGYGRSLDITARDLYGLAGINADTIGPLNEAFIAARAAGGNYRAVLKDKCNIRLSINDGGVPGCDETFFKAAVRVDDFVMMRSPVDIELAAKRAGVRSIHTLADLEDACRRTLVRAFEEEGGVCIKCGLAYERSLRFEKTTAAQAEAEFNAIRKLRRTGPGAPNPTHAPKLQDYMVHFICRLADERGLAIQFHTGMLEGNGNDINRADPSLLTNLCMEYTNARFDMFHIGYPHEHKLSYMAKAMPNVFIDFSWAHIISPEAAVNALVEYLDAVPANKINGFGGDYCMIDPVYGHQYIARENIARALATKVDLGVFDTDRAKEIARMLLFDNPNRIFDLKVEA